MQPERVALLLAAGFSRRYGSDKRLAGSPPLILRTLATLLPCHDSVLVVLRQRDETLCRLLADSGAELTQVPRDGGLGDSLAHGVRTLLASGRPIHSLLITLADMPHLRYVPVISDALPEDGWTGRTGFVHQAVMDDFADLSGHQVYACGAPIVVDTARAAYSSQRGLPPDEFHADAFTSEADKHGG